MEPFAIRTIWAAFLFLLISHLQPFTSLRPETRNRFHMDRVACTVLRPEIITSAQCDSKHISWTNIKINVDINASRPIQDIWIHVTLYYKYNGIVYNKFPIDLWENLCDFIDGKRETTYFLNFWMDKMQRFSNLNHSCPYSSFSVKASNLSLNKEFSLDKLILPSGQFRLEMAFTEDDRVPGFRITLFFKNAEHVFEKI